MKDIIQDMYKLTDKVEQSQIDAVISIVTDNFESNDLYDYDDEIEFLSLTIVCSYYELFNNDKSVEDTREFGFDELIKIVETYHKVVKVSSTEGGEVARVNSNLLATLRDIDVTEYVNEGYYEDDLMVISSLLYDVEVENTLLEDQIETNHAIQSSVNRTITNIISVYEEVIAGSFEIEPYFGLSTLKQDLGSLKVEDGKPKLYKSVALKGLASILSKYYPVVVSTDRQFNMETILNSQRPVYFPMKVAEYLYGRVSTKNLQSMAYAKFDGGSGWEVYSNEYIKPNLKHFLNQGVKLVVEKNGFVDDGNLSFQDEFNDIKVIKQSLKKMERSMVTMAVIPELESASSNYEDWTAVKIRLVDVTGNLPNNQTLVSVIIKDLMDGLGSSSGQDYVIEPERVEDLASYKVYEYAHTFDAKMANLRPLFAYQALDVLQAKGETVDWSNIILGKGLDGRTVTSREGSKINLSSQLIHNIIAGSRSGKGVMTLNILSTAIASNRPVFYADRKPDMASLFAEYVGLNNNAPNMYLVNGSAYEGRFDPKGVLNYDNMADKWRPRVPEWWDATSYSDIGDVVYYRGIMFTLGLLLLRFWAETSDPSLYEKLNGDRGIVVVYDEFTNWQNSFSTKKLNPRGSNGLFGKDVLLNKKDLEEIDKAKDELDELESQDNLGARQKSTLRTASNVLQTLATEKRAYASDLLDNLDRTLLTLNEKKNAGFKNTEERRSDIFVIGQNVEVKPLPEGITFSRNQASGGLNADRSYENTCAISNFLYNFSTDWFMGYNRDYSKYMRADLTQSPSHSRLTQEARNFVYYSGSRDAVMGDLSVNTIKSNAEFFKPYLILNNALEPKPLSDDPEERKAQCQQADYQYVGGVILNTGSEWDKIRSQNLVKGTDELRPEIGFFDYLEQMARGTGSKVDPKAVLGRSKEIADMVVAQMGYDGDYLDFLMDLRPEWNFGAQDIVDSFATPDVFKDGLKRLPTYLKLFGNKDQDIESTEDLDLDLDFVSDDSEEDNPDFSFEDDLEDEIDIDSQAGVDDPFKQTEDSDWDNGEEDETDYYTGESRGNIEEIAGVVNPFVVPDKSFEGDTEGVLKDTDYADLSTASLIAELKARGIPVGHDDSIYLEGSYGKADEMVVMGETVKVDETQGTVNVPPISSQAKTEQEYYTNYFDFCESITLDVIETFGGYSGIEVIIVKDGVLYINNVKYNKRLTREQLRGLPLDKQHQVMNSNYAHIFNFAHITKMTKLAYLGFDSNDFVYIKVRQDLKIGNDFNILTLFRYSPSLFYLVIRGKRYQRDTAEEELVKSESIFTNARKREMLTDSAEQWGTNTVNSSWDSTKNMYKRKGWGWKLGGTAMLGVTAVAGAGLLGFKGVRELKKGIKELFKID